MREEFLQELHRLYADSSKHSVYQSIPEFVSSELGYSESIDEKWRGDRPRLAWLLKHRSPKAGEHWCDFGANTGFFTLSLAHRYPQTTFTAIEANSNHSDFIRQVAAHFELKNVEIIERSIGIESLVSIPKSDFLLHLNVLHHAGHDFDSTFVPSLNDLPAYVKEYLSILRDSSREMFFQIGSNWGGDKKTPIIPADDDTGKFLLFTNWLVSGGWKVVQVAFAAHDPCDNVVYENFGSSVLQSLTNLGGHEGQKERPELGCLGLDEFPGEFYRRFLYLCESMKRSNQV